jgi:5-methylthioribose kinase
MAFDTGAFVGELFLAYVAQEGHSNGEEYAEWILQQIETFWNSFVEELIRLWDDPVEHTGYKYGRVLLDTPEAIRQSQGMFLETMLADTLGFAGMKMLRRIVGIAHVEDLESIQDKTIRAYCERHGLEIAKVLIKNSTSFTSITDATQLAREKKKLMQTASTII